MYFKFSKNKNTLHKVVNYSKIYFLDWYYYVISRKIIKSCVKNTNHYNFYRTQY